MIESFETRLIDCLLGLPGMDHRETRSLLLGDLPKDPISLIARDDALRQDITEIVKSVIQFGEIPDKGFAIEILIITAKSLVKGLNKEGQLDNFLNEFKQTNHTSVSPQNSQNPPEITVPFVIVSMTLNEANQLKEMLNEDSGNQLNTFRELTKSLKLHSVIEFTEYYGQDREDWKPYTCSEKTIKEVIIEIVYELNKYHELQESDLPVIQPYFGSTDCFESDFSKRANTWDQLRKAGCVIIVDSVSLFHPDVRDRFSKAEISSNENVSILTISPVNPCMVEANMILEELVISQMEPAFLRFGEHLDKRCEIGIGDLRSIKRWFFSVLPETVEILSRQKAQPQNRRFVREVMGPKNGMDKLWTGGSV